MRTMIAAAGGAWLMLLGVVVPAGAAGPQATYPPPTSFEPFRMASPAEEIALARSAAPASIANDAEILTLGSHDYQTTVKGKNGFTCLVQRSWVNTFDNAEFWNPKIRVAICLNPPAVRSVLPADLETTRWVLAGVSKDEMAARTRAALAAHRVADPEPGAMSYMMSKQGYITDNGGHWYSHVMFFMPHTDGALWGANSTAAPVFSQDVGPMTYFFVLVPKWSDGTAVFPGTETHTH
jgi:hypothetical protein